MLVIFIYQPFSTTEKQINHLELNIICQLTERILDMSLTKQKSTIIFVTQGIVKSTHEINYIPRLTYKCMWCYIHMTKNQF